MKKLTLLFIWLLLTGSLFAQSNFAPDSAFWNYSYYQHNGYYISSETFMVESSTFADGVETKVLKNYYTGRRDSPTSLPKEGVEPGGVLIRRNDSIFSGTINADHFLFGFNMNIGDTIHILSAPVMIAVVDTLYDTMINSLSLKKWKLTKYCNSSVFQHITIVEDIGPIDDFLFWNIDGCIIGGGEWFFGCYSSDVIKYNEPCIAVRLLSSIRNTTNNTLRVFPNPTNDRVQLQMDKVYHDVSLKITDAYGKIVYTQLFNSFDKEEINLAELPSGNYMVQLSSKELNMVKVLTLLK
jgi:hypothetical protein